MSGNNASQTHPNTDEHTSPASHQATPSHSVSSQFSDQWIKDPDTPPTTPPLVPGNTYSPPLSPRSILLGSPTNYSNNARYPGQPHGRRAEYVTEPEDYRLGGGHITLDVSSRSSCEQHGLVQDGATFIHEKSATNSTYASDRQACGDQGQHTFSYDQPIHTYRPGKKKALCVGINYVGQSVELQGCVNDAYNVSEFLSAQFGYKEENIRQLTDSATDPRFLPTRENIISGMHWLVKDAQPTDALFFHFSGHGGQTKDLDGDEADGFDEVIYPLDYEQAGHIVDDEMHEIMVQPLRAGCRLTAIFDCSHSGSALDLPYTYSTDGKVKEHSQLVETGRGLLSVGKSWARGDMSGAIKGLNDVIRPPTSRQARKQAILRSRQTRCSEADVISWSACKDSEKSDDAFEGHEAVGAMSHAFIQSLKQKPRQSYRELLNNVRVILRSKYQQKPQLSSSHIIDTNNWFII